MHTLSTLAHLTVGVYCDATFSDLVCGAVVVHCTVYTTLTTGEYAVHSAHCSLHTRLTLMLNWGLTV